MKILGTGGIKAPRRRRASREDEEFLYRHVESEGQRGIQEGGPGRSPPTWVGVIGVGRSFKSEGG